MEKLILNYSKEGIANIIGKKGKKKKDIEKFLKVKLKVEEGKITIDKTKCKLNDFELENIFDALAMGFSVKEVLLLKDPNYIFERINLKARLRPTRRRIIKARIIGKAGKIKRLLEEITNCYMKIFGNYIGIIGEAENVAIAKRAIEMLIQGRSHTSMQKWLEHAKTKLEELKEITEEQLKELE